MNIEFNEKEIEKVLLEVVNNVHPSRYGEVRPHVYVYTKDKYLNLEFDEVRLGVNYDRFGYIENQNGKLVAKGWVLGVGHIEKFDAIRDAIEFLVKKYYRC